ncbi:MAG: NADH:flavin oxidoreductase [Selenomonadaceae bacterium]|nr:NADH:flavin oxidoreductase [Selenomonadaceae bacterium]
MKNIFEQVKLRNLTVKNRLIRSATWEGVANPNGSVTEAAYKIYEELAKGGIGAIITGFTSVADNDFYFDGMMRLSRDELIPEYQKLAEIIHRENCPVIAQLALGAYYRETQNGRFVQTEPDEMTPEEIQETIDKFVNAAQRAEKAGYDGVQIHAAHFFFLSRFISPLVNHRNDAYGGSAEGRARILTDIMRGIRKVAPKLHITIKINCNDFTHGGLDEDESLVICKMLAKDGIDSIEVSGNGTSVSGVRPHVNEGYFAKFAAKLAKDVDTPVIVVGGLRSRDVMENLLNSTDIALLSLSRPLLREPNFPTMLEKGETSESKCVSCNACYSSHEHRCIFRK